MTSIPNEWKCISINSPNPTSFYSHIKRGLWPSVLSLLSSQWNTFRNKCGFRCSMNACWIDYSRKHGQTTVCFLDPDQILGLQSFLFYLVKTKVNTDKQSWGDQRNFNLNKKKIKLKDLNPIMKNPATTVLELILEYRLQ